MAGKERSPYLPVVLVVDALVRAHAPNQKFRLERHISGFGEGLGDIELRVHLGSKRVLEGVSDQGGVVFPQDIG